MTTAISITERIYNAHEDACKLVVAYRERIAKDILAASSASDINALVIRLAEAEGSRDLWSRLLQHASYVSKRGEQITEADALKTVFLALSQGADDSWSGRGNDVKRSYFDGVRAVAQKVEYMF